MSVPDEIAAKVLAKCGRCCCLCRRFKPIGLQVHHIVLSGEGGTDDEDNLIALCITCHSAVHSHVPFTRRFTSPELKEHRENVYRLIAEGKLTQSEEDSLSEVQRALAEWFADRPPISSPPLEPAAIEVLLGAARSRSGRVLSSGYVGGHSISVDGKELAEPSDHRSVAKYKSAVRQLVENDLLESLGTGGEVFEITHAGYLLADHISAAGALMSPE